MIHYPMNMFFLNKKINKKSIMIIILNHLYISFINKLWGYGGDLPVNPTLSKACLKTRSGGGDRRRRRRRGGGGLQPVPGGLRGGYA